ncbi:hypothetical protein EMCRGX_G011741 [Ephydatia muelleri]
MNITICDRCNVQLQIPLIDEINLRQHQQSKSCKAVAAKVKASASQPKITSLLRHVFASPAASDATAAAVQPVTPISSPSSTSAEEIVGVEVEAEAASRLAVTMTVVAIAMSYGRPWCAWADVRILPHSGSIPIGQNGTFACASNDTFLNWFVTLPGQSPLSIPSSVSSIVNLLKRNGVFYDAADVPSLRVNGSWENNGTKIECVAIRGTITSSDNLVITVYGRPGPPLGLQRTALRDLELTMAWDPPLPLYVAVTYEVTLQDLTDWSEAPVRIGPLADPHYTYRHPERRTACHRYLFTVVAKNVIGKSDASNGLITQIPQAPQFNTTLRSKVQISNGSMAIYVTFDAAETCQDFSVQYYDLELVNIFTNSVLHLGPYLPTNNISTSHSNEITLCIHDGFTPDNAYSCHLDAYNIVGQSSTSPSLVYTTNVALATITGNGSQLSVTCFFIEGTRARGCVMYFETPEVSAQYMIPRLNNNTAIGTVLLGLSVNCYNISVVDWEEDGSVGSQALSITTLPSEGKNATECGSHELSQAPSQIPPGGAYGRSVPLLPIVFTIAVLLVAVIATIIAALFVYHYRRHRKAIEEYSPRRETIKDMMRANRCNEKRTATNIPPNLDSLVSSDNLCVQTITSPLANGAETLEVHVINEDTSVVCETLV